MTLISKYVSPSGTAIWANADNSSGDDTRRASYTTMLLNMIAGDKTHLMPDDGGSLLFSRTTNIDSFTNAGTNTQPMVLVTADSAGVEIGIPLRLLSGGGRLITTNMADVLYTTGRLDFAGSSLVRNIRIRGIGAIGGANSVIASDGVRVMLSGCSIASTVTDTTQFRVISLAQNYINFVNCDILSDATASGATRLLFTTSGDYSNLIGCRFENGSFGVFMNQNNFAVMGCQFIDIDSPFTYSFGVILQHAIFTQNSIFNSGLNAAFFIDIARGGGIVIISHNVIWDANRVYEQVIAVDGVFLHNNAAGMITFSDLNAGDWGEVGRIELTADPFVNSGAGDLRLNAVPGGGQACRDAGIFTNDLGAIQAPQITVIKNWKRIM